VSDDDLGRRLHAALAPPTGLRVRPGAVARLRERGQAARRRRARTAAAAAAVAVLGLVAVPQLAGAPGAAPAPPPADQPAPSPVDQPGLRKRPTDPGPLGSPLEVRPVVAAWTAPTCAERDPRGPVVRHRGECLVFGQPLLTVRAVDGLSWSRIDTALPQWEAYAGLLPADAAVVRRHAAGHRGGRIGFVVGGRPVPWAMPANGANDGALHLVFVNREEFTAFTDAVTRGLSPAPEPPGGW
jgi:hypothetical protein